VGATRRVKGLGSSPSPWCPCTDRNLLQQTRGQETLGIRRDIRQRRHLLKERQRPPRPQRDTPIPLPRTPPPTPPAPTAPGTPCAPPGTQASPCPWCFPPSSPPLICPSSRESTRGLKRQGTDSRNGGFAAASSSSALCGLPLTEVLETEFGGGEGDGGIGVVHGDEISRVPGPRCPWRPNSDREISCRHMNSTRTVHREYTYRRST